MRYVLALVVVAVCWSTAVYVHQRPSGVTTGVRTSSNPYFVNTAGSSRSSGWEDPVAVLIAVGGVAIAAGIVATGRSTGSTMSYQSQR